jgi:hypothetical protein
VPAFRRQLAAAALAAALLTACDGGPAPGPPSELSKKDSTALTDERRSLDAAIATEAKLSASPQAARKLRAKVQAIVSEGAFETEKLDEFGLAALGRLGLLVPNLVEADSDYVPVALYVGATRAFLRFAERDPARALLLPVEKTVRAIERTVERSEAGPDTRILPEDGKESPDVRVADYLQEAENDIQPIWPKLSRRLRVLREGL